MTAPPLKSLIIRRTATAAAILALTGCKIVMSVPDGGQVNSESGSFNCASGQTCEIDILDGFFEDTFSAAPKSGQQFLGWKKQAKGLCGGQTADCDVSSAPLGGNPLFQSVLESDEQFYLEPVFAPQGGSSFNLRYCEVLIGRQTAAGFEAEVWNSEGINDCPEDKIRALDAEQIARENDAAWASVNGPRYWVIDTNQVVSLPPGFRALEDIRRDFGGIEMRLITSVSLPTGDSPADSAGYQPVEVARDTIFTFLPGRRVYELTDPDGRRYMMQSFTQAVKQRQHITELVDLADTLDLPPGWSFRSYILEEAFRLPSINGMAEVVTDNLQNTYQRVPD